MESGPGRCGASTGDQVQVCFDRPTGESQEAAQPSLSKSRADWTEANFSSLNFVVVSDLLLRVYTGESRSLRRLLMDWAR